MATSNIGIIRPYRKVRVETFGEGSSQSFKMGDPLTMGATTSGERVIVATDACTYIVGFAAEDATGTAGTRLSVWLADAAGEFQGNTCTAAVADVATTSTLIHSNAGLVADTTNAVWRVDTADTAANQVLTIVKLIDTAGDTNGRVVFKVLNTAGSTAPARVF